LKYKGIITLEFVLCILVIIIVLSFFVTVNLSLKYKLEDSLSEELRLTEIKKNHYKENNWVVKDVIKKPKSASNGT